jgi:hypothetical protein
MVLTISQAHLLGIGYFNYTFTTYIIRLFRSNESTFFITSRLNLISIITTAPRVVEFEFHCHLYYQQQS